MPRGEKRDLAVQTIFKAAPKDGYVDKIVVMRVQSVLTPSQLKDIFPARMVTDGRRVSVELLPNEWRRKVISTRAVKHLP